MAGYYAYKAGTIQTFTGGDIRKLGVIVDALAVRDGGGWREIALDDPGLLAALARVG